MIGGFIMSKRMKTYTVVASAYITADLKIEATSRIDAYNRLQDKAELERILEISGFKGTSIRSISGHHKEYEWNTFGKKPEQYSAYTARREINDYE